MDNRNCCEDTTIGAQSAPGTSGAVPAADIVGLAAKLIRLHSHLKSRGTHIDLAAADSAAAGWPDDTRRSAQQAAVHSGIEVVQGFAASLIRELDDAHERDAFHYEYQPIVSVTSGIVAGYEALMRWRRGAETVTPALFLPMADETRLIVKIQQRLLYDVAAAYGRLASPVSIAINWSPAQISNASAVSAFIERIGELRIDPRRIVAEITECTNITDPRPACASIRRLKEKGFQIALDNYGTGHCCFSLFSRLPIDLIKIDGSFISEMGQSVRAAVMLDGIIDMAHKLGSKVVAKSVETTKQLAALRRSGCDFIQGNIVGRPVREPVAGPVSWLPPQEHR